MSDRAPIEITNLDTYGDATLPWSRPKGQLDAIDPGEHLTWFLGTVRPDGRPHAAGVGALWVDDEIFFTSGAATRKSKDLAENAACTLSVRLEGLDLVFEGTAERVMDGPTLERVVERFRAGGWPAEVLGDAFTAPFSAPSAGPPPWDLYRLTYERVFGVASAEPHGATRWRFA